MTTDVLNTLDADVKDYMTLLKPRLMSLVIFTAIVGMILAPGTMHPFSAFIVILSIAVGAGGSAALNMWYDADIDAKMKRTLMRPIPAGRIEKSDVYVFGMVLSVLSVITLGLASNWLAGGLLALTIFYYAVVYTMWLKRTTSQNIVIGGGAGALPPVVAWAAVTGDVSMYPMILFAIIFMWTPPHFWSLSLITAKQYEAAAIPMMPLTHGNAATLRQMKLYTILTVLTVLLPAILGFSGILYVTLASALSLLFMMAIWAIDLKAEEPIWHKKARRAFFISIFYLFAIFLSLVADKVLALMM